MRIRTPTLVLAAALVLACGPSRADEIPAPDPLSRFSAAYTRAVKPADNAAEYRNLFAYVLQRIQRSYAIEIDSAPLFAAATGAIEQLPPGSAEPAAAFKSAIKAALALLDPYSSYFDPAELRAQQSAFSGSYVGLGLQVDMVDGLVRIVSTMEGTPAARAGLLSGDLIARVDEQPVPGLSLAEAIARMRGEPGTPVTLLIRRAANEFPVSLLRDTISRPALRWSMEDDVLVLRLSMFTDTLAAAVLKAIDEASAARAPRAVILDMRGNPGGRLDQAVRIADAFLARGEITSLRGRTRGNQRSWKADPAERLEGAPMVVLLDSRSASASELVAAALQDNGRATIMGQRSFGKGSVQSVIPLGPEKGALRLTTALYHAPSGRAVQHGGVVPDIELTMSLASAAGATRRESDRARSLPGSSEEPAAPKLRVEAAHCAPPAATSDPALACALAYLRAGNLDGFLATLPAPQQPAGQH